MKVSGFTFIRNAIKFDYPVVESITSVLPLCDEFIVAAGNSSDATRDLISSIGSPKIRIVDSVWDDTLREGGRVLAAETDKALSAVDPSSDWAFYVQADEVVHEKYLESIRRGMELYLDDPVVEGLLFHYLHFYGSYEYVGISRQWYRREVRIIRPGKGIASFGDAQGFRIGGRKLKVAAIPAWIYHYGWVKPPGLQQAKQEHFHQLWHNDRWIEKNLGYNAGYDYTRRDFLERFRGTHPAVMLDRVSRQEWRFDYDPEKFRPGLILQLLHLLESKTGWRPGEYRNYEQVRE